MKKLTPIIQFYINLNFFYKGTGKDSVIDGAETTFKIGCSASLAQVIKAKKGLSIQENNYFQLLMPIEFQKDDIQFSALPFLPEHLIFYIQSMDSTNYAYTGIPQHSILNSILYLSPQNTKEDYIFNQKSIAAFPCCSTGKTITTSDSVQVISANNTLQDYIDLINVPDLDLSKEIFDFILNGISTKTVLNPEGLAMLKLKLMALVDTIITIQINDHNGNKLSKTFNRSFITENKLDKSIIGIIDIPKDKLLFNDKIPEHYEHINQFSLPFPNLKTKLKVILSTASFDNVDNDLTINEISPTLTIINHPELENYKQISFSINNYPFYLNRQHLIKWTKKKQIIGLPFDPIINYNPTKNSSEIKITKKTLNT